MFAIVAVLVLVFVRPAGKSGERSKRAGRIKCVNNLKNVALALRIFSIDNPGTSFSGTNALTAADFFVGFSNELSSPHILICPADRRQAASNWVEFSNSNLSYFANRAFPTDKAGAFLAGDRNLATNGAAVPAGSYLSLSTNIDLGWTQDLHAGEGHVALGDGSVQLLKSERLNTVARQTSFPGILLVP